MEKVEINKCSWCGEAPYIDWWLNFREGMREETFVRCPECGQLGPKALDEGQAVKLWNEAN